MFRHGNVVEKIGVLLGAGAFAFFTIVYFKAHEGFPFGLMISELMVFLLLDRLKKKMFEREFGDVGTSQAPPEDREHQATRYLLFKSRLLQSHVTKSHVEECFDLVDIQIEVAAARGELPRKVFGFAGGVVTGMLGAVWAKSDISDVLIVLVIFVVVAIALWFLLSLFPSKVERLKEMKYFMKLYCRESAATR